MSFLGKEYVLASQENFEAFVDSLGPDAPADFKKALINHKGTVKLAKNGDQYTFSSSQPDGSTKVITFKDGVEFDEDMRGNIAKATVTMSGNTMNHVQKFNNGVTLTMKREFSDSQVVVTITSSAWNGSAKRIYKC